MGHAPSVPATDQGIAGVDGATPPQPRANALNIIGKNIFFPIMFSAADATSPELVGLRP